MPGIHETGSRLITSGLSELKKQIQKVVNKFSGRSVKEHEPDLNLPQNNDITDRTRRRSIGKRKVKAAKADTPVAAKKVQENSGKTSLKPGKAAPEKTKSKELPAQNEPLHDTGPSGGAAIKKKAKDVLPDMIPGKVLPPPNLFENKQAEKKEKDVALGEGTFGSIHMVKNKTPKPKRGRIPNVLQKQYVVKEQSHKGEGNTVDFAVKVSKEVELQNFDKNSLPIVQHGFLDEGNPIHHKAMMEFGGHSLRKLIETKKPESQQGQLDNATFRAVAKHLLLQLSSLHKEGIVHRDIKPDNILVDQQGRIRLIDFGLAKKRKVSHPDDEVFIGSAGSPLYMAPEVAAGEKSSVKADIWSAGVMFYELLTSEKFPFFYDSNMAFNKNAFRGLRYVIKNSEELPNDHKKLLLSMLQLNPSKRVTAEKLLNLPFFQNQGNGDENHFELQSQHQLQYRRLALLEKELEETEALNQKKPDNSVAQKIIALTNEVSAAGAELKYLQSKMELLDMKSERRAIEATLKNIKEPVKQSDILTIKKNLAELKGKIKHIDEELKPDSGKMNLSTKEEVKGQINDFESQLSPLKAQQADLEEQLRLAENGVQDEQSKKKQEELEFIIPVVERDIQLKKIECQKLGSKAELLQRKHQLTNEAQNELNAVSSDQSEPLSQALNMLEEEIKAVDIKYDEDIKAVMDAYQKNNPS